MKGFRFETFNIHPGNQAAFDLCRAIAAQQYDGVCPVILLGADGAGKSHLLWSIVNEVRARAVKTGLALVMAQEFPAKVRNLIRNPEPIQRGKPAILLVDGLEEFRDTAADLEAVVRVFLDNHQPVVLASSVLPDRLSALSPACKLSLNEGLVVEVKACPATSSSESVSAELEALRRERDDLKRKLSETATRITKLETALEAYAEAAASDQLRMQQTEREQALQHQIAALKIELETARQEREDFEAQLTRQTGLRPVVEALRGELAEARAEAESALAQQARLQGLLSARKEADETLRSARAERDAAREEAKKLAEQADAILAKVDVLRKEYAEYQAKLTRQCRQFLDTFRMYRGGADNTLWRQLEDERDEARALAEAFRSQGEQERKRFDAALVEAQVARDHAEELFEEARREQDRLRAALEMAQSRTRCVEFEFEKARGQVVLQAAEMDALREAAVSQVATANIQAGEMEHRIARLESALEATRAAGRATEADAVRLSEALAQATETLRMLAQRQAALKNLDLPPPTPPAAEERQTTFFESEPFEALPADTDSLFRDI